MKTDWYEQDDASSLALTERVRSFLAECRFPALRQIEVEALGETIILQGRVPTSHERQLAIALWGRIAGVHQVVDRLSVSALVPLDCESKDRRIPAVDRQAINSAQVDA